VTDVISSGPERPPGRRRPPAWLVLAAVAVALTGALRLWGGATGSTGRTGPTEAAPVTAPVTSSAPPVGRVARFRLDGRPGTGPAGLRLLVGGSQTVADAGPAVVTATGEIRPVTRPRLAAGQSVQVGRLPAATTMIVLDRLYRPLSTSVLPDRGGQVRLGPGLDTVMAAADGGLIAADSAWNHPGGRLASYTAGGQLRWQRPLADPTIVWRDTPYGLLVWVVPHPERGVGGGLALIDARTGLLRHGIGAADQILATTGNRVAWIPHGCADWPAHCSLVVTRLDTRSQQAYPLPANRVPSYAAFSPDAAVLALSFAGQHEFIPASDPDGYVSILTLGSGQVDRMPGLTTTAKHAPTVAWGPDRLLVLGVNLDTRRDRLLLWTPGSPGPVVLPATLPPYSAATYLAVLP